MTDGDRLLRWASSATPSLQAAELLLGASRNEALQRGLMHIASEIENARFLIVNVDEIEIKLLGRAIQAFHSTIGRPRLCLAGNRQTLTKVSEIDFDNDRVGLMIDEVDADIAYSTLVWDRIEAVRFSEEFVARSAHDMRTACAMDSMLRLSHDIGLRTLAFNEVPKNMSLSGRCNFDYLPNVAGSASVVPLHGGQRGGGRKLGVEVFDR